MTDILRTRLYSSLYYDFINNNPKIGNFLISPQQMDWANHTRSIQKKSNIYRETKRILAEQNSDLTSDRAKKYIFELQDANSCIVITGQQIALFASPLYTIFKAITTLKLTEKLNSQITEFKYIPVFWLESEDHDFQEVNHVGIWKQDSTPQKITYTGVDRSKTSLRHYQLSKEISQVMVELKSNLLQTEYSAELFTKIEGIYREGENWVLATRSFLKELFHESGLLFFQPGDEAIKKVSGSFFLKLLAQSEQAAQAFSERYQDIETAGYSLQVSDIKGKTYIHLETDNLQREHLYRDEDGFFLRSQKLRYSRQELEELIKNHPERISTSVISRPLIQSWLMPVVAYIAGPAEIAYWSQLGGLFTYLQIAMPVVYPRISASIIEPKIARYIEKHNPEIANLPDNRQQFVDTYFKNRSVQNGLNPFEQSKVRLSELEELFHAFLTELDPTLVQVNKKTFERIQGLIDTIEQKSIKVREQKDVTLYQNLTQIHEAIFPNGQPQERFISIIYFLNKFGPDILQRVFDRLDITKFDHQFIYIT